MDLSIVIVSFNTRALLERTLAAVSAEARDLTSEVIVVDNASLDGSVETVRRQCPEATLVVNAENRFYVAANNQGLSACRGRYALVLNSDAEPRRGTLRALVDYLDRHGEVGALGVRMVFPDGRLQRNCARLRTYACFLAEYTPLGILRPGWRRRLRAHRWYEHWDRESALDVGVIPGSCLAVRRTVVERVGALDERFRHYFAEDDWCARIHQAGFAVRYAPLGEVVHPEGASARTLRRLARRLYFEDMLRYVDKYFGAPRARLLWLLTRPTKWALDVAGARRGE
jgi:hypothetical protein